MPVGKNDLEGVVSDSIEVLDRNPWECRTGIAPVPDPEDINLALIFGTGTVLSKKFCRKKILPPVRPAESEAVADQFEGFGRCGNRHRFSRLAC